MNPLNPLSLIRGLRAWLNKPQATIETDPQAWFSTLFAMPDPDPILRDMGRAELVYNTILRDPHVIGDVRSIRGNFRSFDYRLVVGDEDDPASVKAHALCEQWMKRTQPAGELARGLQPDWLEVMWQMTSAILTGYRAHELVWGVVDGQYLPVQVLHRPNRRFVFNMAGEPLLISREAPAGQPVDPQYFVISRHMASAENPYGIALLSACFWMWTFKTGGFRVFVKYCEKHGLPWPVGRYALGTPEKDLDRFEEALATMLESGYLLSPNDSTVELLVPSNTSVAGLPQQQLIDACNREMSKALTGQAMVAELNKVGARAASETAADRQSNINDADRDIAGAGMGQIFRWITLFNFGEGVAPPTIEYYHHEKAGKDRAETYEAAARLGARPSKSAMLEELGIPEAKTDDDAQHVETPTQAEPAGSGPAPGQPPRRAQVAASDPRQMELAGLPGLEFAKAAGMTEDEAMALVAEAGDQAIEDHLIAPVVTMLARFEAEGKTLQEFKAALEDLVGQLDDEALREVLDRALTYSILRGAATRAA